MFINIAQSGKKFPVLYVIMGTSLSGRKLQSATLLDQMNSLQFLITNPLEYFLAMYTCVYQVVLVIQNNALFYAFLQSLTDHLILFDFIIFEENNLLRNSPLYSFYTTVCCLPLGPNALSTTLFSHTIILVVQGELAAICTTLLNNKMSIFCSYI